MAFSAAFRGATTKKTIVAALAADVSESEKSVRAAF